jgi:hypothetical protein
LEFKFISFAQLFTTRYPFKKLSRNPHERLNWVSYKNPKIMTPGAHGTDWTLVFASNEKK